MSFHFAKLKNFQICEVRFAWFCEIDFARFKARKSCYAETSGMMLPMLDSSNCKIS